MIVQPAPREAPPPPPPPPQPPPRPRDYSVAQLIEAADTWAGYFYAHANIARADEYVGLAGALRSNEYTKMFVSRKNLPFIHLIPREAAAGIDMAQPLHERFNIPSRA